MAAPPISHAQWSAAQNSGTGCLYDMYRVRHCAARYNGCIMIDRKSAVLFRRAFRRSRLLQILLLIALWLVGEVLVRALGLPVSGGVLGMFGLLALFAAGFSPRNVQRGADWFLAEMLLFFIPAIPAILNHHELLGWLGAKVLAVILVGTVAVMVVTAGAVDLCLRWGAHRSRAGERRP